MKVVSVAVVVGLGASMICAGCGSGYSVLAMSSPSITQVSPQVIQVGTPSATVTVKGSNFDSKSAIVFNGAAVPTTVVSSDTLAAQVGSSALAQASVAQVLVRNSAGIASNSLPVTISSAQSKPVVQALSITTTSLVAAGVGVPYSVTLGATGGTPTYKWSVSGGTLPAGLGLSSAGVLSGTPSTAGTSTFTAQVQDSSTPAQSQSVSLTLVVAPAAATANPLSVNSVVFASGQVGAAYSTTLSASGGTPSYTWAITSGSLPMGLSLSPNGAISGTPTNSQVSSFIVTASDSSSPVQTKSMSGSISISPSNLTITTTGLASGKNGAPYSAQLVASGGSSGYSWSVSSGSLPAGLSLSSAGVISGTPSANGTQKFTVTVSDSGSPVQQQSASFSIHVSGSTLSIGSTALSAAQVGTAYSAAFSVSGGTPGYTWSLVSGNLPAGLNISGAGVISGTPTASGTSSFTVQVADSSSPVQTTSAAATLTVQASGLSITSTALSAAKVGSAYSASMSANGGTPGYTWSLASGSLPAGLTMSNAGVISGTPTASGTSSFTVAVKDSGSPSQTASATVSIAVQSSALSIISTSLASGKTGTAYGASMSASGGTPAYTWSITSGSLPAGLSLSSTGVISGTPTSVGSSSFTVAVKDSGSQSVTATETITVVSSSSPLTIASSTLASGQVGVAYNGSLSATGGTASYTWSITSGSLPAGLSLAGSTGVISGTPTTIGTASFTVQVADSSSPMQTQSLTISLPVIAATVVGPGTTWYVRADGGTRYSTGNPSGQCDGKADAAYPGSGVNQHCAFGDYRFLWDDQSYGGFANWAISGGDTVIIDNAKQWRVGFDQGGSPNDHWCVGGNGPFACTNPTIPSGTASQHTRILGRNYGACSAGNHPDTTKMTQIYGGYGVWTALNMNGAQYVDVECIEVTRHSQCITHGTPAYPSLCSASFPLDDYDSDGIQTDVNTHDVLLQDMWIHGHTDRGIKGPIGGTITANRVTIAYNGMAGWDFDDGNGTPNVNGVLKMSYSTIEWSGCNQEYPMVDKYAAISCYSQSTGGYGDGIGTPAGDGMSVYIDHSMFRYNTQDGEDFGHIDTGSNTLQITNSVSYANNGGQFKWGPNFTTVLFENNIAMANCLRMSQPLSGAPATYNTNLTDFCRANDALSFNFRNGGTALFANNTIVTYAPTTFDMQCWDSSCANTTFTLSNNVVLGYQNPTTWSMGGQVGGVGGFCGASCNGSTAPIGTINRYNNLYYGIRGSCIANQLSYATSGVATGESCGDPAFVSEPSTFVSEQTLDPFNFALTSASPAIDSGVAIPGSTTDFDGATWHTPPSKGALESGSLASLPTF